MFDEDESILCKIEYGDDKRGRGDRVTLTRKRVYKTGMTPFGRAHKKVVRVESVTAAEWGRERFARFLFVGLAFLALCCLLSAYALPGGKTLRFVLGIVSLSLGVAVFVVCIVAYFRCTIKTVTLYYAGGKMRIASPGITDEEADEFIAQVLRAARAAAKAEPEQA